LGWDSVTSVRDKRFGKVWLAQAVLAGLVALLGLLPPLEVLLAVAAVPLLAAPSLSGHASVSGDLKLVADFAHVVVAAVRYGLLLLAKIALVLPVLVLGAYNNRSAVPRLRREIASAGEQRRFLRMAGAELAIVLAILGVTSVLVMEPPAKASVSPKGPYATTVELGNLEANVVVEPATAGENVIHVHLTDRSGRAQDVAELQIHAELPSKKLGPLRFDAHPLAAGDYAVHGAELALAGDWRLAIGASRGEFEALTATVSVPIRKD